MMLAGGPHSSPGTTPAGQPATSMLDAEHIQQAPPAPATPPDPPSPVTPPPPVPPGPSPPAPLPVPPAPTAPPNPLSSWPPVPVPGTSVPPHPPAITSVTAQSRIRCRAASFIVGISRDVGPGLKQRADQRADPLDCVDRRRSSAADRDTPIPGRATDLGNLTPARANPDSPWEGTCADETRYHLLVQLLREDRS